MSSAFRFAARLDERACAVLSGLLVWLLHAVTAQQRQFRTRLRLVQGSINRIIKRWRISTGQAEPEFSPRFRLGENRTPAHVEREVVRLHVEQKHRNRPSAGTLEGVEV